MRWLELGILQGQACAESGSDETMHTRQVPRLFPDSTAAEAGQGRTRQGRTRQGRAGKRLGETIGEIVFPRNIVLCSPSTPVTVETETRQLASSRGAKKKRHENYAATQAEVVIFMDMDMDTVWMYEVALVEGATVTVVCYTRYGRQVGDF